MSERLAHRMAICRLTVIATVLLMLFCHAGHAQDSNCPPLAGAAMPLDGQAGQGESGWLLDTIKDGNGNTARLYCLAAGNGHTGPNFGYRYTSADNKTDVWTGGCFFPLGYNQHDYRYIGDNPANAFSTLTWSNVRPPPPNSVSGVQTDDWEFRFDPATKNLVVTKTRTTWSLRTDQVLVFENGQVQFVPVQIQVPSRTGVVGTPDMYTAPSKYSNLKFQSDSLSASPGTGTDHLAFGATATPVGQHVNVSLDAMAFSGDGSVADPFTGFMDSLATSDTFTIQGTDISDPTVSGLAATPEGGGWMVASFSPTSVTFRDTTDITVNPGQVISGFGYDSPDGGLGDPWLLISSIEDSNSQGLLTAALEPATLAVLLTSLLVFASTRLISSSQRIRAPDQSAQIR